MKVGSLQLQILTHWVVRGKNSPLSSTGHCAGQGDVVGVVAVVLVRVVDVVLVRGVVSHDSTNKTEEEDSRD